MTWFRVDDGFYSHPKTMQTSLAATGLWVRAGSWVGMHDNDGIVPESALRVVSPEAPARTKRLAAELCAAGLWDEIPGGYLFHDWTVRNPTREQTEKRREAWRRRQAKARASREESRRD